MAVASSGSGRRPLNGVLRLAVCFVLLAFRNLANILTTLRLIAAVPLFLLVLSGAFEAAFWLFLLAALTDLVDGSVAKYLNRPTRFGAFLDPVADKLFSGLLFLALAMGALVPWWLAGLVILRDVAIGIGASLLRTRIASFRIEPLVIGKLCTLMQLLFLGLLLGDEAEVAEVSAWRDMAFWGVVAFTLASGLAYLGLGLRLARRAALR
ncbi:Putative CDP-diacylglycerol--glycerol-3-phosphate 3-phosphatidyl-transferase 2 [bacterium HR40]|nr:Putative CDP-diacylglycerol--glycerol-3-phosphate 3-phosphatidyl-transferase 2 [bacterium HR40]